MLTLSISKSESISLTACSISIGHFTPFKAFPDFCRCREKLPSLFLLRCGLEERWKRAKTYVPYVLTSGDGTICF